MMRGIDKVGKDVGTLRIHVNGTAFLGIGTENVP